MERKKYTFEELREEALKYRTKGEFREKNYPYWKAAYRGDDYELIVIHMPKRVDKSGEKSHLYKWTLEMLIIEALKFKTKAEFKEKSYGAYQAADSRQVLNEICSHMIPFVPLKGENNPNFKWPLDKITKEAKKYSCKSDFRRENYLAWKAAYRRDDYDEICSHMDILWEVKWDTFEKIHTEALKYTKRSDFAEGNSGAYQAASDRDDYGLIVAHMPEARNKKYEDEELIEEAKKYLRRIDFVKGSKNEYHAAIDRGQEFLDKICSHMEPSHNSSFAEREIFDIIKNIYPQAKKIKDMKVKIEGKPYIKGFEIDIYVPELCKGIEFDGGYHHSFEKMRADRGKKKWSDDDIRNYHQLKDAWFATKGITILHIKEEDWELDKCGCIKKILDFLDLSK